MLPININVLDAYPGRLYTAMRFTSPPSTHMLSQYTGVSMNATRREDKREENDMEDLQWNWRKYRKSNSTGKSRGSQDHRIK